MRTVILTAAIFMTIGLSAQETTSVYEVTMGMQAPIGEWYVIRGDEYSGVFYMDHQDEDMAEQQINFTLSEFGTSFEFGNLVEDVDGLYYYEWDGVGLNENGKEVGVYITYMLSKNDLNFFRISIQYMQ